MHARCSSRMIAMMATAALALAILFIGGGGRAAAQCNAIKVINHTHCNVSAWIVCSNGTVTGPFSPAPGDTVVAVWPFACNASRVLALVCGSRQTVPAGGCLNNVSVENGCCADICYDPVACTITFTQTVGPCPCL